MTTNPIYFTLSDERSRWHHGDDEEEVLNGAISGKSSRRNFLLFCFLFSVVHAAVDAVLAFSSAELGTKLGSSGGFTLYIFYTASALLLAKPLLQYLGSKLAVLAGLAGMLTYVGMFFLAVLIPKLAIYLFLLGAAIGGVGAGLLWTGQGAYYSSNAAEYSALVDSNLSTVLTKFAGIFAAFYLSLETCFKFLGTILFVSSQESAVAWRPALFGFYSLSAGLATAMYIFLVENLDHRIADDSDAEDRLFESNRPDSLGKCWSFRQGLKRCFAVAKAIVMHRKLLLILPYQICFGFSAGLIQTYVNGTIVKDHIGEGYIGLLAGLTTLTATLLSIPFSMISNRWESGSYYIMIFGAICFSMAGLMLVLFTDEQIAYWPIIITYYVIHGIARGIWENTNKAMVAIFFPVEEVRDVAYAAIYFASGLSGAIGFAFFQFLSKDNIAIVNLASSALALICFHFGYKLYKRTALEEALAHVHGITSTSRSNSDSSLDSLAEVSPVHKVSIEKA